MLAVAFADELGHAGSTETSRQERSAKGLHAAHPVLVEALKAAEAQNRVGWRRTEDGTELDAVEVLNGMLAANGLRAVQRAPEGSFHDRYHALREMVEAADLPLEVVYGGRQRRSASTAWPARVPRVLRCGCLAGIALELCKLL